MGNSVTHAFLWSLNSGIRDLGTLGGPNSVANGINDNGQVVGTADNTIGFHAFLWTQATGMQDLGTLQGPEGVQSRAAAINRGGQVVGLSFSLPVSSFYPHAFLWTKQSGMRDLGTLGGISSFASGINDMGQVIGSSYMPNGALHAFLWTEAGGMKDIGTLGGSQSLASAINNNGEVVGLSDTASGVTHAFLWTQMAGMQDLGTLPGVNSSSAAGVNMSGQVVGSSWQQGTSGKPFLWTRGTGMQLLGPFGNIPLSDAGPINNAGDIIGSLYTGSGYSSYLLTPKSTTLTTLASNLNPSAYGQPVTLMAMVTSSGPNRPTGRVVFRSSQNGSNFTLGTAPLNASGVATLTKSNLTAFYPYPTTAVYLGDASNLSSTSSVLTEVVKQTTSVASITSSPNPSILGQAVTFTATITSPTVTVTGPVTFAAGNMLLGTAQLSRGTATFTTSALPTGSTRVQVTYSGNSNVAKSSTSLTQTVH